ncbi:MAG: inverse autotransporter beta domain-containing protein, partial [Hafnia sp.]
MAKTLGLTAEKLKKYNQFRSFPRPFELLAVGDEIDIPVTNALNRGNTGSDPVQGSQLASQVSSFAGTLRDSHFTDTASGMGRSMASGAANSALQQWLGQFGTVETQINLDEDLSLDNSSLDWLVPVYDFQNLMFFAQTGIRNKDNRTTFNLGSGVRTFTGGWMYGANVFFDDDITGRNRRIGLGAEAWTDYLQLSSNTYFGLTNWHQSRDFDDYDERPANGYDLRVNGWLPAWPQLGGKLEYEKYRGDQVALFGKDKLQRDPYAVTVGINWTPFPLLTLGVDQRIGKGEQNETNVNMQLTWRPGDDWESQITPESIRTMRQISGSRYDLVNRNNNIVLEYKKQELFVFNLSLDQISNVSESVQPLEARVSTKYDLDRIDWDLGSFANAGGKLRVIDKTHFELTLPAWQEVSPQARSASYRGAKSAEQMDEITVVNNLYRLTASAVDSRGNRSPVDELMVEVLPPDIQMDPMNVTGDEAPADGVTPITVSGKLTDSNGKPLAGDQVEVIVTFADGSTQHISTTSGPDGFFSISVTSVVVGKATVMAISGQATQKTTITFVDASADVSLSGLTASPDSIVANGTASSTLTLTLKDSNGRPLTGEKVDFVSSLMGSAVSNITDHSDGTYTATLTSTKTGNTSVSVKINSNDFGLSPVSVALTADAENLSATQSTLSAAPAIIVANGAAKSTVTLSLKDANGNPVSGQTVIFASSLAGSTIGSVTDSGDGTYTASLSGTTAGNTEVTANVGGSSFAVSAASVTLTADASNLSTGQSTLAASPASIVANGTAASTVTLTLRDANGNLVPGQTVTFASSLAGSTIGSVTDSGD